MVVIKKIEEREEKSEVEHIACSEMKLQYTKWHQKHEGLNLNTILVDYIDYKVDYRMQIIKQDIICLARLLWSAHPLHDGAVDGKLW